MTTVTLETPSATAAPAAGMSSAPVLSIRNLRTVFPTVDGDVVAIESPTYFGILQALESLGMRVLEIPAHPRTGMDLGAFERAIKRHKIKACVIMPNCHSPLSSPRLLMTGVMTKTTIITA